MLTVSLNLLHSILSLRSGDKMTSPHSGRATGTTNELAKEWNRDAAERTLTAWIGYYLGLIRVGVAFDQIIVAFQQRFPTADPGVTVASARWSDRPPPQCGCVLWRVRLDYLRTFRGDCKTSSRS